MIYDKVVWRETQYTKQQSYFKLNLCIKEVLSALQQLRHPEFHDKGLIYPECRILNAIRNLLPF